MSSCCLFFLQLYRIGSKFLYLVHHFYCHLGKQGPFTRCHVEHFNPLTAYTHSVQYLLGLFYPFSGSEIATGVMTVALHAAHGINTVSSFLKCFKNMQKIHLAGTWDSDNFDIGWICQTHGTCQVRGCVSSEVATKGDDNRFKFLAHRTPSSKDSILQIS
jgi:hypothetical protein